MKILAIIALWTLIICSILGLVGWRNHYMGEKVVTKVVHIPQTKFEPVSTCTDLATAEKLVLNHMAFECSSDINNADISKVKNLAIENGEFKFNCQ